MIEITVPVRDLRLAHMPWKSTIDMVKTFGYTGGINFGYFSRSAEHPRGSVPEGACITNGFIQNPNVVRGRPALTVTDRRINIQDIWGLNEAFAHTYNILIQGGPWLVHEGKISRTLDYAATASQYPGIDAYNPRPRVAVGIWSNSLDSDVLICCGTYTLKQVAQFMVWRGIKKGIAGDGGSSVSLVRNGKIMYGGTALLPNILGWFSATVHEFPDITRPSIPDKEVVDAVDDVRRTYEELGMYLDILENLIHAKYKDEQVTFLRGGK